MTFIYHYETEIFCIPFEQNITWVGFISIWSAGVWCFWRVNNKQVDIRSQYTMLSGKNGYCESHHKNIEKYMVLGILC